MPSKDARKAVRMHEDNMHPGRVKTFSAGGPTSASMKKYGRNMARVMNQKGKKAR